MIDRVDKAGRKGSERAVMLRTAIRPIGRRNRRKGGGVLEIMLLLPVLITLAFGVVDYGYYLYLKNTFEGAAELAVRAGVPAAATNSSITTAAGTMLGAAGISSSNYTVTISPTSVSGLSAGSTITVTITGTWGNLGTKLLGTAFGGIAATKQITGSAVMLKEST